MNLLDLPDCMLEQVLEYLSYDEIAKQRIVSLCSNQYGKKCFNFDQITFNECLKHLRILFNWLIVIHSIVIV